MRAFQIIMSIVAALMVIGMFVFNSWVNNRFKVSELAKCYMPINITTLVLVLIVIVTVFIRK